MRTTAPTPPYDDELELGVRLNPFENAGEEARLEPISVTETPARHPVGLFMRLYAPLVNSPLLPHEEEIRRLQDAEPLFDYGKLIEPIEVDGGVDFKVLRQGARVAMRERRTYRDQWMSETIDSEYAEAMYREITAAAVLRRPRFSKGRTPTRERSYLYLLRGVFPVFAENHARLRMFVIEAEPYVEL